MNQSAIWLSEQDVVSMVSLDDTIEALESSLIALSKGDALNVPKALGGFGDGSSMHSLGSSLPVAGFCGYKNWVHTKRGAKAVFVLFDAEVGNLLAIIEANSLGQLRTSAMTGVGTKWIAPKTADDMAIIGSGRQAIMQVAAVNAVRPLKTLRVWSPTPERRLAFTHQIRDSFDIQTVVEASSLEEASEGAGIVTLVTRAKEPFLGAEMLARNTHLNAVGAILPANAEFKQDVFDRVEFISVDDVTNTKKASKEFTDYFDHGAGKGQWDRVTPLGEVISSAAVVPSDCDISLFKSMGMGLSDLSVAKMAFERAVQRGRGQSLPLESTASLRWNASK